MTAESSLNLTHLVKSPIEFGTNATDLVEGIIQAREANPQQSVLLEVLGPSGAGKSGNVNLIAAYLSEFDEVTVRIFEDAIKEAGVRRALDTTEKESEREALYGKASQRLYLNVVRDLLAGPGIEIVETTGVLGFWATNGLVGKDRGVALLNDSAKRIGGFANLDYERRLMLLHGDETVEDAASFVRDRDTKIPFDDEMKAMLKRSSGSGAPARTTAEYKMQFVDFMVKLMLDRKIPYLDETLSLPGATDSGLLALTSYYPTLAEKILGYESEEVFIGLNRYTPYTDFSPQLEVEEEKRVA